MLLSLGTIFIMLVLGNRPLMELKENYLSGGLTGEVVILVMQDLLLFATDDRLVPDHR